MAEIQAPFYDFIKSGLYAGGASGGKLSKGYQDPTYLSFSLLFVPGSTGESKTPNGVSAELSSPLFSKEAEDFYVKLTNGDTKKYEEKLQAFKDFKTALFKINNEMPWFWQSLAGVDRLLKFDPTNPYWGGSDAKLEITCLEAINLTITGLMNLYRKAVFDEEKWCYVLPANLRKFSLMIHVQDLRPIDTSSYSINPDSASAEEVPINLGITGENNTPVILFQLSFCEFDIASGTKALETLSNAEYTAAASDITIHYERLHRLDGRYLMGVISESQDKVKQNDLNTKDINTNAFTGKAFKKSPLKNDPLNLNKTIDSYKQQFSKEGLNDKFKEAQAVAKQQLINLGNKKKEEILGTITSTINDKIPSVNNILMNAVNKLDQASNIYNMITPKVVEETIKANVYGVQAGQSIIDALEKAAKDGLGNVYK